MQNQFVSSQKFNNSYSSQLSEPAKQNHENQWDSSIILAVHVAISVWIHNYIH